MTDQEKKDPGKFRALGSTTVDVFPWHCLLFAYAQGSFTGPYGEGNECKPRVVALDPEATHINITVTNATDEWAHGPAVDKRSTADGRTGVNKIENSADYQAAAYRSEKITLLEAYLNQLVGCFGQENPPDAADPDIEQFAIGTSGLAIPIPIWLPTDDRYLYLGMQDGYEWNNNVGWAMFVQVATTTDVV